MMKRLVIGLMMMTFGVSLLSAVGPTSSVSAACNDRFLTFPAWYRGIVNESGNKCNIKAPEKTEDGITKYIWTIALNILEIMIQVVAYIAIGYLIYGGYTYMRSMGASDNLARAKDMITNAIIGLVLSLLAVLVITYIISRVL